MVIEYANHLVSHGHDVSFYFVLFETIFELHPRLSLVQLPCRDELGFIAYGAGHKFSDDLIVVDIIHLPLFLSLRNRVVYFAQADDVEYYGNIFARMAMHILYRLYLRNGASVITVDERLTNTFRERYGFPASHTVPNGINLGMFYPEPDQGLVHSKGGNRAVVFMSRGDHYRKGFDIAMEVLGLLSRETGARMELWVCGTPLEQGPFPCKVRNFGVVSDAQLRHILSSADIFFYPSRHEGFGLFPLEAMACGCVVITTEAVPYARSLDCILTSTIGDVDGLLSHLTTLIDDEGLLRMLQSRVAQAARRYDISTSRDGFVTALASVIKEQTGCA